MPKRLLTLFSFLLLFSLAGKAQETSIQLKFPTSTNQKVFLAFYYNGNILVKDSAIIDQSGHALFESDTKLQQGIYQLYFSEKKHFDFLLGEVQKIKINESENSIQILGSKESVDFNNYHQYLDKKKDEQQFYLKAKKKYQSSSDSLKKYNQILEKLDNELKNYWLNASNNAPDTFYAKFLKSSYTPRPDSIPQKYAQNDSLKWIYQYNFIQNHFWDFFDLKDTRMWYTPTIKGRLTNYFNKVLLQQPDTIIKQANQLINYVEDNPIAFQNLVTFIVNNSFQSEIMGIENVFVDIAERYYLSGKADWVSEKTLEKIKLEVFYRRNNLMGMKARELVLEDAAGEYHSLHQLTTPYTLLVFWEPNCSHCKTEIPKLYEDIFLKANPSQLAIYAVYTQDNLEEWQDFISDNEINDWINVWDPQHTSQFNLLYNVRSTPTIYLLDKDKIIVAKNMSVDNAKRILESLSVSFNH
ncbi:thioredoxin-like domain-containing protein [Sunxiuqinia sp. A32]|uniref:thioredoxin-like domain-containing protein n=1 Tax=Sunxiuqinia sp. A32 TaxID=3461496 RepID=UPI004045F157